MSIYLLIASFGLWSLFLGIHVAIWRFRHPKQHALTLIALFLFVLVVFSIIWIGLGFPLNNLAAILLLYVALGCAYIQIFPASQADSPSLRILLIVHKSKNGLTEEQIKTYFSSKSLLEDRIDDLLLSKLIYETNHRTFALTNKGRMLIFPFIILRNLIGLPKGSG